MKEEVFSGLTFALPKGRLGEKTLERLKAAGIEFPGVKDDSRALVFPDKTGTYRALLVKPGDVPTYIERGIADIGVAGKDTLLEENRDIYEVCDLRFGACRLCICGYPDGAAESAGRLTVATKYPNVARTYYDSLGLDIDLIKLNGSVELAPIIGLSDVILDVVESGKTLEANGLAVIHTVAQVSARLAVNKVSLKTKKELILPLVERLREQVKR